MKSLKQIADEIGTGKMNVYRFVKSSGITPVTGDALHGNATQMYDETAENTIKAHFQKQGVTPVTLHDTLHKTDPVTAVTLQCNDVTQQLEALDTMRKRHKQEVEELKSAHAAQLDQLRSDHAKELDRLTDAYKHEVDALTASIDRLTADNDRLQRELSEERQHSREQSDKLAQLCDQSQKLQLASLPSVPALIEDTKPKPSIWQRIFGKK